MKLKKPRILITGGQGFIGSNLRDHLIKTNKFTVISWDKKFHFDIFDDAFEEALHRSDYIYHLAARVSVRDSFKNPSDTFYTNALGTARVVQLCVKYKKKIIYPSSASIYNSDSSPYAHSKKVAEDIVWGVRKKIPVVVLRLFNVYGEDANRGSAFYNFLNDKRITVNGNGMQTRDFINVDDVCSIMIDSLKKKWDGRIVDVGTGNAQVIEYVADLFRYYRQHKRIYYGPPVPEVKNSKADIQMLKYLYKEPLTTDIVRDIERMVKNG